MTIRQNISAWIIAIMLSASCGFAGEAAMRAMWIYKTEPLMASVSEQDQLFAFCKTRQITDLFWQVHFEHGPDNTYTLKNAQSTRSLLRAAHTQSIRIHSLGGDPSHALTQNHPRVLAMADAFLGFNQAGKSDEHFDGMHLDIEPHALPQWKLASDEEKCGLLAQFVDINTKVAERLHSAAPGIAYGADIVFWLGKTKSDGSPAYPITYRSVTKDAARHLLDALDNVAIMSYRNTSGGRNGIIALVEKTILHADTAKGRAFVGVKMAKIGPETESFFGRTEQEMMTELGPVDETYRGHHGYAGLAFFMYEAFRTMPPGR